MFGTSFDTSADRFQNYYKDLSQRLKNRELDLVIVVNMFLTGFDATTLNTLWVDKNLRQHGLIQAYSRTNRILNSVKTYGNIVSFRDLEQATNDALCRCSATRTPRASSCSSPTRRVPRRVLQTRRRASGLLPARFRHHRRGCSKKFIALFGAILRLRNILASFDDFADHEILSERRLPELPKKHLPSTTVRGVPRPGHGREGVDQRRRRLRDRAHQAGRSQRHFTSCFWSRAVARARGRLRRQEKLSRADEHPARHRLQRHAAQQARPDPRLRRLG